MAVKKVGKGKVVKKKAKLVKSKSSVKKGTKASKADVKLKPLILKSPFLDELERYCKDNGPCHVVDSGYDWAIVCKVVDLDVRITAKGNNPFQEYSSENNSYHKVKSRYGVMVAFYWGAPDSFPKAMDNFWSHFPDIYYVSREGEIARYLDKVGKV